MIDVADWRFEVVGLEGRRIDKVRATQPKALYDKSANNVAQSASH